MRFFTAIALLLASIVCQGQDLFANGLAFTITGPNTVEVVNLAGNYDFSQNIYITVPAQVEYEGVTYDVTGIGDKAFWACSNLVYISLPETITYIGGESFAGCTGLRSIVLPKSLTKIGDYAFSSSGLTSVQIPASVYEIGERCFYGSQNLQQIEAYVTLKRIGARAFHDTPWYSYKANGPVVVGGSVLYSYKGPAPSEPFSLGYGLLSTGIKSISGEAFIGDDEPITTLTSITITMVEHIGDRAFYGCSGLVEINQPGSVEHVGEMALEGTAWLENARNGSGAIYLGNVALGMADWNPSSTLSLRDGTVSVADYAFGCMEITNLILPNSLREIGNGSFMSNEFAELHIPNSVTSIGANAFEGCFKLKRVYMGSGVQRIGRSAFRGCEDFEGSKMSEVHITDLASWCKIEFGFSKYHRTIKAPRDGADAPRRAGFTYMMDANPLYTAGHLFIDAREVTTVDVDVERISDYAFIGCEGLRNVVLRANKAGTTIGMGAFMGCGLQSVTLPYSVKAIGRNAFEGCNVITNVYAKMIDPMPILENTFSNYNTTLHVRQISQEKYAAAPVWNRFSPIKGDIIVDSDFPDLNGDNKVDVGDVNIVLQAILNGNHDAVYDINGDHAVNVGDVNAVLGTILKLK